jgi:type I restriction enzyme, S subunit
MNNLPKLRFPEFHDSGEWDIKQIGALCDILNNRRQPISSNNREKGEYPYYGASGIVDYVNDFIFDERLLLVGEDGAKWGANERTAFIAEGKYWVNNHAHVLKPREISDVLLENFLVALDLIPYITGAAPPKLTLGKLKSIPIPFPTKLPEQQKIADCLSSIADRITLETKKLDTLKAHKKGLMQKLFPAEGETLPKLRFPQFRDAGEWEEKKLGEIAAFHKGKGISKADIDSNGKIPCVRYGELYTHYKEIISSIFSKTNLPINELFLGCKNDVIIPSSGETKLDIATASCLTLDGVALGGDINVIRCDQNGIFMSYYLNSCKKFEIAKIAQGDTVVHLYSSQLSKLDIRLPAFPEQQTIADCLASLDETIAAQAETIALLKVHKKGLMQQLFPSVEEVRG